MNKGKTVKNEKIVAKHLQESGDKLKVLLSMCLNAMLEPSYLSQNFILSILNNIYQKSSKYVLQTAPTTDLLQ